MKTREFDIKNYSIRGKIREDLAKEFKGYKFNGVDVSASISINGYRTSERLEDYNKKYQKELIEYFKSEYEIKKEQTIKNYAKVKKYVHKILFDDKDYAELCEVLENNYYCQATSMLEDLLDKKSKGNSVRAMKFKARIMQVKNEITCD